MAYDPNWPQNGQLIDGDRFREQFAAIIDLIQAGGGVSGATVDSVTTGNPGDPATAGVTLVGATLHFTFAIPAGVPGPPGADGGPGEVTTSAMNAAISAALETTSPNTNGVDTLDQPFADSDMETLRQKVNETILNGRR